jgi:hypothetical protein
MRTEPRHEFRIVIQFTEAAGQPPYSLVVYGTTGEAFLPFRFRSLDDLAQRFEAAGIPAERRPKIANPPQSGSQILYSDTIHLSEKQLDIFGVKRR